MILFENPSKSRVLVSSLCYTPGTPVPFLAMFETGNDCTVFFQCWHSVVAVTTSHLDEALD